MDRGANHVDRGDYSNASGLVLPAERTSVVSLDESRFAGGHLAIYGFRPSSVS